MLSFGHHSARLLDGPEVAYPSQYDDENIVEEDGAHELQGSNFLLHTQIIHHAQLHLGHDQEPKPAPTLIPHSQIHNQIMPKSSLFCTSAFVSRAHKPKSVTVSVAA